jgi:hypothetical protein
MTSKERTLADFEAENTLQCHHCDGMLPETATVDLQWPYVVVLCPECGCMTAFKIEVTQ